MMALMDKTLNKHIDFMVLLLVFCKCMKVVVVVDDGCHGS